MQPYSLGLYEKGMPGTLSLSEKLKETGEAGFDFMELSIDETDEKLARLSWGKGEANLLRRDSEETGIPIKSICLSGHRRFPLGDPAPEQRTRALEIMEQALTLASRLGVRIIQIAAYDVYYKDSSEETKRYFTENLEKSLRLAAREGVMLAFETMETPFIDTVEKAAWWVRQFSSPYLQIYPDTGNITNAAHKYGSSVCGDIEKGTGHIAAVHLKESLPGIYREVPYGEGHVDFAGTVGAAWKSGVRLYTAEFWHIPQAVSGEAPWRDTLRKNCGFFRAILNKTEKSVI